MKACPNKDHGHYSFVTLRIEDYPPKCPKCMTAKDWADWHRAMDAKQYVAQIKPSTNQKG